MSSNILKSPRGMKSYIPETAVELEEIKGNIRQTFRLWGYQPFITPTLEYYEALTVGMGSRLKKELYKFIDYEGNILTLRPELTAPIARTIAARVSEMTLPGRFSYSASVFRYDEPQIGKNREIYQMGVELIGEGESKADAEALILAIEAILRTGLRDFKFDIGHTGYLDGIIEELELDGEEIDQLKTYLIGKNIVGLNNYIEKLGIANNDPLYKLPGLRGSKEILNKALEMISNKRSKEALQNLRDIYSCVADYGLADYLTFDLGLIRGFDYYTGVVFEGFTEKLGYTICGGGRYDNLIGQYCQKDIPAIGFAIGLERVRLALKKQSYHFQEGKIDDLFLFPADRRKLALATAKTMREKGYIIILEERDVLSNELIDYVRNIGAGRIIFFHSADSVEVITIKDKKRFKQEISEGWEDILWQK